MVKKKDLGINEKARKMVKVMQKLQKKELDKLIKLGNYYPTKKDFYD